MSEKEDARRYRLLRMTGVVVPQLRDRKKYTPVAGENLDRLVDESLGAVER